MASLKQLEEILLRIEKHIKDCKDDNLFILKYLETIICNLEYYIEY